MKKTRIMAIAMLIVGGSWTLALSQQPEVKRTDRTTHLEGLDPLVQLAQAAEILAGPANTPLPVVLVCDCNSSATAADPDATPTYALLRNAGFGDSWQGSTPEPTASPAVSTPTFVTCPRRCSSGSTTSSSGGISTSGTPRCSEPDRAIARRSLTACGPRTTPVSRRRSSCHNAVGGKACRRGS
jgi:hypothetical protein